MGGFGSSFLHLNQIPGLRLGPIFHKKTASMKRAIFPLALFVVFSQALFAQKPLLVRTDMRWANPEMGMINYRIDYAYKKNSAGRLTEKSQTMSVKIAGMEKPESGRPQTEYFDDRGRVVRTDHAQQKTSRSSFTEYSPDGRSAHSYDIYGDDRFKKSIKDSIWDENGRLNRVEHAHFHERGDSMRIYAVEKFQIDEKNRPVQIERFTFFAEKRVSSRIEFGYQNTTDSLLFEKKYAISRDSSELLESATIYDRDERGRPTRLWEVGTSSYSRFFKHPKGATVRVKETVWTYDEAGLVSQQSHRDSLVNEDYSKSDRFAGIGWSPTAHIFMKYDEKGRLAEQRSQHRGQFYLTEFFYDPEHGQLRTTIGYEISEGDLEKPKARKGKPTGRNDYYYEGEEMGPKAVQFEVTLSPNPVSENARFTVPSMPNGTYDWAVFSMDGREMLSGKGTENGQFSTADWTSGVYFLKITAENGAVETVVFEKI